MKYLILVCGLLSACTTVPVKQSFPEMPAELQKECDQLITINTETATLSEITKVITKNYQTYHECAARIGALNAWYKLQADLFNKSNN